MQPTRKCRETLLCLSAFCWAVCSTETRAKPKARAKVSACRKKAANVQNIPVRGRSIELYWGRLEKPKHSLACELGLYESPIIKRVRRWAICVESVLSPTPDRNILHIGAENPTTWTSRWHRESLRARAFSGRPLAPLRRRRAGEFIERNGTCRRNVQGIYLMIHGDAHREITRRNGVVA